jgi:hypothetical protein
LRKWNLQEAIYRTARALENSAGGDGFLQLAAGDIVLIRSTESPDILMCEHSETGRIGKVHAKNLAQFQKHQKVFQKKSEEDGFIEKEGTVSSAEEIVQSIADQSRKDKLGGFFGASSSEIDAGIRDSRNKPLSRSSENIPFRIEDSPSKKRSSILPSFLVRENPFLFLVLFFFFFFFFYLSKQLLSVVSTELPSAIVEPSLSVALRSFRSQALQSKFRSAD